MGQYNLGLYRVYQKPKRAEGVSWQYVTGYSSLQAAKDAIRMMNYDKRYEWAIHKGTPSDTWLRRGKSYSG